MLNYQYVKMLYSNEDIKTLANKMREISRRWHEAQKASRFKSFTAGVLEPFANVDDMLGNMLESFGLMKKSSPTSVRDDMLGYLLGNKNVRKGYKIAGNLLSDLTTAMAIPEVRAVKSLPYIGGLLSGGLSGGLTGYAASSGTAAERAVPAAVSAVTGGILGSVGQKVGGARAKNILAENTSTLGEAAKSKVTTDRLRALLPDIETQAFDKVEGDVAKYATELSPEHINNLLQTGRSTKQINFTNSFLKDKVLPMIEDHALDILGNKTLRGEDQIMLIKALKDAARNAENTADKVSFNKVAHYLQDNMLLASDIPKELVTKYSSNSHIWGMLNDLMTTKGYVPVEEKISELLNKNLINDNVATEFLLHSVAKLPKETRGKFVENMLKFISKNRINPTDPVILKRLDLLKKNSSTIAHTVGKLTKKITETSGALTGQNVLN